VIYTYEHLAKKNLVQKVWWANIRWKSIVEISTVLVINFGGVRKSGVHSSKKRTKVG